MPNEYKLMDTIEQFKIAQNNAAYAASQGYASASAYALQADAYARIIAAFINTQTTVVRFPDE